jgi:hypothetical protein
MQTLLPRQRFFAIQFQDVVQYTVSHHLYSLYSVEATLLENKLYCTQVEARLHSRASGNPVH